MILHGAIDADLDIADRLLARHLGAAVQRFGAAALSVIDLPPLTTAPIDVEQIRVAAVLLWAREVEAAGLPSFVEALAEGLARGRVTLPVTTGGDRLMRYYRAREERFGEPERHAIYDRLFGEAADRLHPFPPLFDEMVEVLAAIGRGAERESLARLHARLRFATRQVAELLSVSAGITGFAARDVAAHIREAVEILKDPDVTRALGGGGLWTMIRLNGTAVTGREYNPTPHLMRARAGQQILSWLADASASLDGAGTEVERTHPVVEAAQSWELARYA